MLSEILKLSSKINKKYYVKAILKNVVMLTGKHRYWNFFLIKFIKLYINLYKLYIYINFIKRGLRLSCQYCEIRKNTNFEKHLGTAASENRYTQF